MAPVSPHAGFGKKPAGYSGGGPIPQEKYVSSFANAEVPRTENFNPNRVSPAATPYQANLLSPAERIGY